MVTKSQRRRVETPLGPIVYTFERKNVKNRNLRIRPDGTVFISAPINSSAQQADLFLISKCRWIVQALERLGTSENEALLPECSDAECEKRLMEAVRIVYPLIAGCGVSMPEVKIRRMRSQWGNCHWKQGYITMNRFLARCPEDLRQYVALHELIHFLELNHGSGFYAYMDQLLPDWREKRMRLKGLSHMLRMNNK